MLEPGRANCVHNVWEKAQKQVYLCNLAVSSDYIPMTRTDRESDMSRSSAIKVRDCVLFCFWKTQIQHKNNSRESAVSWSVSRLWTWLRPSVCLLLLIHLGSYWWKRTVGRQRESVGIFGNSWLLERKIKLYGCKLLWLFRQDAKQIVDQV